MPRPKAHYGTGRNVGRLKESAPLHHVKTPDLDNLKKFVLDVLNEIVWRDDSQIVQLSGAKEYSENPRTEIIIEEII